MILIISNHKNRGEDFKDFYHRLGIPSFNTDIYNLHSEIGSKIRSIIILINSNDTSDYGEEFIRSLKLLFLNAPIFMISEPYLPPEEMLKEIDCVCCNIKSPSLILNKIQRFQEDNHLPKCGTYRLYGLDASLTLKVPTYHGLQLPLTSTEKIILRTLIRFYPTPLNIEKIIKYAFLSSNPPEKSNIRTHICGINRKFHSLTDRKLIELSDDRSGYIIQTPDIIDSKEKLNN